MNVSETGSIPDDEIAAQNLTPREPQRTEEWRIENKFHDSEKKDRGKQPEDDQIG